MSRILYAASLHTQKSVSPKERANRLSTTLHPIAEHCGESGTIVHRAITDEPEEHSWEFYVAMGAELIDPWLEHESSEGMSAIEWRAGLAGSTSGLVSNIEAVMKDLDRDIGGAT